MEQGKKQIGDNKGEEIVGSPSAKDIHDAIYNEGESELDRPGGNLFWSGLAAGLSMSLSMLVEGVLEAYLPDSEWSVLVSSFGYCMGFVIVILGKQQLFTENTLTPILPLLDHKSMQKFWVVIRLWGIVLFSNLLGTLLVALVVAHSTAFSKEALHEFEKLGFMAMEPGFGTVLLRGIFAGWLIALMAWLLPHAGSARVWIIILVTYIVAIGHFSHVIAGSMETFTLAAMELITWSEVLINYTLPSLIGNILGGVVLVAAINHAQSTSNKSA